MGETCREMFTGDDGGSESLDVEDGSDGTGSDSIFSNGFSSSNVSIRTLQN